MASDAPRLQKHASTRRIRPRTPPKPQLFLMTISFPQTGSSLPLAAGQPTTHPPQLAQTHPFSRLLNYTDYTDYADCTARTTHDTPTPTSWHTWDSIPAQSAPTFIFREPCAVRCDGTLAGKRPAGGTEPPHGGEDGWHPKSSSCKADVGCPRFVVIPIPDIKETCPVLFP